MSLIASTPDPLDKSMTELSPALRAQARRGLARAADYACRTQNPDGSWQGVPDPRVFDTAIAAVALAHSGPASASILAASRARSWLAGAPRQQNDSAVRAVEEWLSHPALTRPPTGSSPTSPPLAGSLTRPAEQLAAGGHGERALLLDMLAVAASTVGADAQRLIADAQGAARAAAGGRLKQWQRVMLAAAQAIGHHRLGQPVPVGLITAVEREQWADGSFNHMPAVTAVAHLALTTSPAGRHAAGRSLDYLLRTQHPDGTWRFTPLNIWDTTLLVRALRGVPAFERDGLATALDFIEHTQSADGGWGAQQLLETETDTTGSALLALAGTAQGRRAWPAAERYAARMQQNDGLWATWQSSDDHVRAPDVIAHMVSGLHTHGTTSINYSTARTWLAAQHEQPGGWKADWYTPYAYAVSEIGTAVGWTHPATRRALARLTAAQNPDGGWPAFPGDTTSSPAATGLALAALTRFTRAQSSPGRMPAAAIRALIYLIDSQQAEGDWPGTPILAGPRPFLLHYPTHTHAFTTAGLRDALLA